MATDWERIRAKRFALDARRVAAEDSSPISGGADGSAP